MKYGILLAASAAILLAVAPAPAGAASPPIENCMSVDVSTSNWAAEAGHPATDPGPDYVRLEAVRLLNRLLAAGTEQPVASSFVTFASDMTATAPLQDVRQAAGRRVLLQELSDALHRQPDGSDWTSLDRGIQGCVDLLPAAPTGAEEHVVVLTDGRPVRPDAGAPQQITALQQGAVRELRARGGKLDVVVYGDAASHPDDPAFAAMGQLAASAGGQLYPVSGPLALLQEMVRLAASIEKLPLSGRTSSVSGSTTVPVDLPAHLASATVVALRSSPQVSLQLQDPRGTVLATTRGDSADASTSISPHALLHVLTRPQAGRYEVLATGQGALWVAVVARGEPVAVAAPAAPAAVTHAAPPSGTRSRLPQAVAAAVILAGILGAAAFLRHRRREVAPEAVEAQPAADDRAPDQVLLETEDGWRQEFRAYPGLALAIGGGPDAAVRPPVGRGEAPRATLEVDPEDGRLQIRVERGSAPVSVDGRPVPPGRRALLVSGSRLRLGQVQLTVRRQPAPEPGQRQQALTDLLAGVSSGPETVDGGQ